MLINLEYRNISLQVNNGNKNKNWIERIKNKYKCEKAKIKNIRIKHKNWIHDQVEAIKEMSKIINKKKSEYNGLWVRVNERKKVFDMYSGKFYLLP